MERKEAKNGQNLKVQLRRVTDKVTTKSVENNSTLHHLISLETA